MKTSKQTRREAKLLFRSCLLDGNLNESRVRGTIERLIAMKPRGYIAILEHFKRLAKLEIEKRTAIVESPLPLSPDQQAGLQAQLASAYGRGLNLSFVQNPALIGGLRIKVGSDVFDGSIQGRLNQLQATF